MAENGGRAAEEAVLGELMVQAQAGHAAPYARLLGIVAEKARAYFLRRMKDADAAEDFAQEVLLSVHSSRRTYDPKRSFTAWLYSIMHRRYVDSVRALVRRLGPGRADVPLESIAAPPVVDHGERAALLQEAIARLPEKQRTAIVLTHREGLSTRAAARRLGLSEVALRVRAHRARQALYRILIELNYEDA